MNPTTVNSFETAKRLLCKELDKCVQLLKDTESKWNEYIDLKLHYINCCANECDFDLNGAHVSFTTETLNEMFGLFCNDEYNAFIEWCKDNDIDFDELRDNVGRTSSFYLDKLHNNYADKYVVALAEASQEFQYSSLEFADCDNSIVITTDLSDLTEEEIEDYRNEMLNLVESIYDDLKERIDNIVAVYDYIAGFKENQVDNFKEYVKESWIANI